jgi:ubiquinone/menaquinone biosynthesis C-methylase UbiE
MFLREARREGERRYPPVAGLVAEQIRGEGDGTVVLDLGCGPALLLPALARVLPRARFVGVDPSKPMLEVAKGVLDGAGPGVYELLEGSAEQIPLEDGTVDVVVTLLNLHEWSDAEKGMGEVRRVLTTGGTLVLMDVNRGFPYWRLRLLIFWAKYFGGRPEMAHYLFPYPDSYRPYEVEAMLKRAGLDVVSSDTKGVEYLYVARSPNGRPQ